MLLRVLVSLLLLFAGPVHAVDCLHDPLRAHELEALDDAQIAQMQDRFGAVEVPARVNLLLTRLLEASPALRGRTISVLGYRHTLVNAHAADHGKLLVSSAVWADGPQALEDGELAAVLAHELVHIKEADSLHAACSALGKVGSPGVSLADAIQTVGQEAFDASTELSAVVRAEAHARELSADAQGLSLLAAAGFDPTHMVQLVKRISRPANDAMGSGTHPLSAQRVQAIEAALAVARP